MFAIALIWGGGPERVFALSWAILFELATLLNREIWGFGRTLTGIDPYFATIDVLACLVWIGSALYANRNYTLWIAAMQVLAVSAHLARGLVESISPIAYATTVIAPGWFQLLIFGVGLSRHIIRRKKYGLYRDWRISNKNRSNPIKKGKKPIPLRSFNQETFVIKDKL
ncbi:MAG: hypothetical protein AAGK17_12685 [Pseudomonadota bacterium]